MIIYQVFCNFNEIYSQIHQGFVALVHIRILLSLVGAYANEVNFQWRQLSRDSELSINMASGDKPASKSGAVAVKAQEFLVGPRYVDLKYIGEGAYGMVV